MKQESSKTEEKKTSPKHTEAYHFAGGGEYEPVTIEASSIEEATEAWEKQKKAVTLSTIN